MASVQLQLINQEQGCVFEKRQQNGSCLKQQSLLIPFENQLIHNFCEVKLMNQNEMVNQEEVKIQTSIGKVNTKTHNFPRVVKEVQISLGNGQVLVLKDLFTNLPVTLTDEMSSMFSSSMVHDFHSS
eukprot:TRINITY_DN122_c0_g1_i1.p4 TRINITY_DN122_c0_g1~~TRINITY_DN122_c0_g1_i1.p4  ORF type:complete len:127 (+),score=13.02 TRINITY_DN122_c0_g1_i1:125-505(+)